MVLQSGALREEPHLKKYKNKPLLAVKYSVSNTCMEMNLLFDQYASDVCLPFWAQGWEARFSGLTSSVMLWIAGPSLIFQPIQRLS